MDWTQIAMVAVPSVAFLIGLVLVLKPVRQLIPSAHEFELTREGLKIRADRQVKELSREAAAALPEPSRQVQANGTRVISMASPDQRDRLPIAEFRKYLENVSALDPRAAVLEAFERVQAGLAARFGKSTFPPPGTVEAAELVQLALDSHQYRVYELMYPVYAAARHNEGFSLSHDTAIQFCETAVALVWLIEGNPAIRELGIKVGPHEHLGLFDDADIGEDAAHRNDHFVLDVVSQLFFEEEEEPSITREELGHFVWGMVEGLEPESVDKSREEWLEVAERIRARLTENAQE
jgi:hypothetical protein